MPDRLLAAAAVASGLCLALAVAAAGRPGPVGAAQAWLERRRRPARVLRLVPLPRVPEAPRSWLELRLERAGWSETVDRFAALTALVAATVAAAGAALGSLAGPFAMAGMAVGGGACGAGLCLRLLIAAGAARRRRLLAELAPTLELACLEVGGGNSVTAALTAVTHRTAGELSRELRLVLAGAALASSESADMRLRRLGERLELEPLTSLAAVIATSRDYGSGVLAGLRAIAVDLRRARRRELIAASRTALTRVLVPAATGVLMPFLAILLYPAITSLTASLR